MVRQFMKKRSKRLKAKIRYKVEKKVKEHRKKVKKDEKKNLHKKKRKDPGIPNSLPFKEQILQEAEKRKIRAQEEQNRLKEKRKKERERLLTKKRNLDNLVQDAYKKQREFEKRKLLKSETDGKVSGKKMETSLKAYYKEFKKVIDAADVVLEVLDARDPLGSRCVEVEQAVLESGTDKKLVLVLNKIDLVPRENVEAWLKHLRNEFPTVAFKASTQAQTNNLARRKVNISTVHDEIRQTSLCLGADILMKLLGNYARSEDVKRTIRVGVVGFPNTGKSSIINSLKRSKVCNVGGMPGITKTMQEVQLDKHIRLLDSPGVVMARSSSDTNTVLRNVVKLETVADPTEPVEAILKRCNKQQMMLRYNLPDYKDVGEFLSLLATRQGKLKKGGIPDEQKAAKMVLSDWMCGKITYFTHPPEQRSLPAHISAEIVTQMGKSFDIDAILKAEADCLKELKPKNADHILVESMGPLGAIVNESDLPAEESIEEDVDDDDDDYVDVDVDEDDEEMEEMEEEMEQTADNQDSLPKALTVSLPSTRSGSTTSSTTSLGKRTKVKGDKETDIPQLNKAKKLAFKKMKKQRKRSDVVATQLSDAMSNAFNMGSADKDDEYSFETDFT
ncbi:guanine nucleotide-binding protein-like 3 homolog [Gigantopelta aegis]|uniref:guanine nucleotide-binding protein-like 3 homolog n=1 Tax=Gigantopelta aegis TaxID=1735272 RepID=UPI001B88D898|nr:guanine nucleotide-binding protein-like 3 homolog [Gigantopelta aegis]